jgi:hypothetical protein
MRHDLAAIEAGPPAIGSGVIAVAGALQPTVFQVSLAQAGS